MAVAKDQRRAKSGRRAGVKAPAAIPEARALGLPIAITGGVAILALLQWSLLGRDRSVDLGGLGVGLIILVIYASLMFKAFQEGVLAHAPTERVFAWSLAAVLAVLGVQGSTVPVQALGSFTLGCYVASSLLVLYAASATPWKGAWSPATGAEAPRPARDHWAMLLGLTIVLVALTLLVRWFAYKYMRVNKPSDAIFMFFMDRANSYEGIQGGVFRDYWKLTATLAYFAAVAATAGVLLRQKASLAVWIMVLMAAGFLGKLNLAWLSATGLQQLGAKVANIGTAYYQLAPRVEEFGLWNFVKAFNQLQVSLSTHGDTHPFGPEFFYIALIRVLGRDPQRVAYGVMALATLTFIPLVLTAARYHRSRWMGLAAGMLYLFTPVQLMLSGAGIDCIVTMVFAWILYVLLRAVQDRSWAWACLAGLLLYINSLLTPGVIMPLLFSGLWVGWLWRQQAGGWGEFWSGIAKTSLPFLLLPVLLHVALWLATGRQFSYPQVVRSALGVHLQMLTVRPYAVWVWLNPFQIFSVVGLPLLAVLLARLGMAASAMRGIDGLLAACAAFLAVVVFAALGPAESQRMFMYCVIMFVMAATPFFAGARGENGELAVRWPLLLGAGALLLTNAAVMAIKVLDYW